MPRCSCAGNSCSCSVQVGDGLAISGTGSQSNPFIISLASQYIAISHTVAGALDLSSVPSGAVVDLTLSANATSLILPNVPGHNMDLIVRQGAASRTITWPAEVEFPGGVAGPTLSTTLNYRDWITLRQLTSTIWVGALIGAAIR